MNHQDAYRKKMNRISLINTAFLALVFLFAACKSAEKSPMESFHPGKVKITAGPFSEAQEANLDYMLAMDPDRLLAPYLREAGITPVKESYGNWENSGLDGHIGGHYLSALAFMHAATGNQELQERMEYMLNWLHKCQEKNGNGYVGGIPGGKAVWDEIRQGNIRASGFSLNDKWVPLYNIHKLFAGLNDVYQLTGDTLAKSILINLSDWFYGIMENLSDEQIQDMLRSEHGGMNEVFVNVADITGDQKYLGMANRLSHRALLDPLLAGKNELTGLHANTQIPKVIGYQSYAAATHNESWTQASAFFWDLVVDKWTVSIGGNSVREHFHSPDDFSTMVESNQGPETCNTYNMLRLTKLLLLSDPQPKYLDYYERALSNHILSTKHPVKGGFVYFTPMRPRHYRVYSQPQQCFWCCVGSGLENPGRYNEMIYTRDKENVYVNLFIPSELDWDEKDIRLIQQTDFPYSGHTEIELSLKDTEKFGVGIRIPSWVNNEDFTIEVNGTEQNYKLMHNNTYAVLQKEWKNKDKIRAVMPMDLRMEYLPDSSNWVSFLHGPIVLAAVSDSSDLDGLFADDSRMGHVAHGKLYPVEEAPMLVAENEDLLAHVEKQPAKGISYKFRDIVQPAAFQNLELIPFYEIHEARYIVYWPVVDENELENKREEIRKREQEKLALEAITIDQVATGEQQPEAEHEFKGNFAYIGAGNNAYWRETRRWFSYQLEDRKNDAVALQVTYDGNDSGHEFLISLNDIVLDTVSLAGDQGNKLFHVNYPIPESARSGKQNGMYELKFTATENNRSARIYHVRLLKEAMN